MPNIRITRSIIDTLKPTPGKQVSYRDIKLRGFGVKVNTSSATYFVQCRVKGRTDKHGNNMIIYESIGRVGVVPYDKAVERAKEILNDAASGITPGDKRAQKANLEAEKIGIAAAEAKKDITLREMLAEYVGTRKKLKESTIELYQDDFERYLPGWLDIPLRSITGSMILAKHTEIGTKSKARADGVMRVLRAVYNHAITMYEDIYYRNPVTKLTAVDGWYKVPRKETYIKPGDLKLWLPAVLRLGYDTTQDFLLLMLFQGSRFKETASLQWKDVDLTAGLIVFRQTKSGVVLEVPVSRYILGRLKHRHSYYYKGPESYVFPSYGGSGHITDARVALNVIASATGVKSTHHDLRRSFLSYCGELKIDIFTRKRLANHAIPLDVTEGYTQFTMEDLRACVEKVAAFILQHAGISYEAQGLEDTEAWKTLSDEQRVAIREIIGKKEPQESKVVDLEAVRVKRRLGRV